MHRIYLYREPESVSEELTDEMTALLPEKLKERVLRYKNVSDRKRSAVAYFIAVSEIERELGRIPEISVSEHGKPYIENCDSLYFNVSHCKNVCVCAVSNCEVGVDIQDIRPYSERTAKKVCCENEIEVLTAAENKDREFARIWAIKESYIKMTGDGFSYGLKNADTTVVQNTEVFEKYGCFIAVTEKNKRLSE